MSVYVISDGRYQKIGRTNDENTRKRLRSLQTGNPRPIYEIAFLWIESPLDQRIELAMHSIFQKKRHMGEWFNLDKTDIELIKFLFMWVRDFYYPPQTKRRLLRHKWMHLSKKTPRRKTNHSSENPFANPIIEDLSIEQEPTLKFSKDSLIIPVLTINEIHIRGHMEV